MANDDNVDIRVRLRNVAKFNRDAKRSADAVDDIGDKARKAARQLGKMGLTASSTRVQLGPFSTKARGASLALGGLVMVTGRLTPTAVGAAEAVATLVGGGAGAGAVGLLALAQGTTAARLGLGGLSDALGGSEEAAKNLSPELRDIFLTLKEGQDQLRTTAQDALLPGLGRGIREARRNLPVLNKLIGRTARTLGGLAGDAGGMVGSSAWGRDIRTVGNANVQIIDNLGTGTLALATATRHLLVEAAPLALWLSEAAERGGLLASVWAQNARTSGDMARFFREARTDLTLLASAGGHGRRGIINLFGAQDVDGTKTLRNLDAIMGRFEAWTDSPAVRAGVGDAIVAEIPQAVAALMDSIARNLPAAAGTAASVFWQAFWGASAEGKALAAAGIFAKSGGFKMLGRVMGLTGKGGVGGTGRGATPATPLFVAVVNQGVGGAAGKGGGLFGGLRGKLLRGAGAAVAAYTAQDLIRNSSKYGAAVDRNAPGWLDQWKGDVRTRGSVLPQRREGAPSTMPAPWNMPRPFEPIISIRLDRGEIARAQVRDKANRRARQGR